MILSKYFAIPELIGRTVLIGYLFWLIFSLCNFELFLSVLFFPLAFMYWLGDGGFRLLLLPILAAALIAASFLLRLLLRLDPTLPKKSLPWIFNVFFMPAFFVSAEIYKYGLIYYDTYGVSPDSLHTRSFISSLMGNDRFAHAEYIKDCRIYLWSYSQRKFVPYENSQQEPLAKWCQKHGKVVGK